MNKYSIEGDNPFNNLKHILKIMRVTLFFLFFGILFSQATTDYSQEAKLNLEMKSTSIKKVCEEIEKRSDYRFIFAGNTKKIITKKVNLSVNSQNIESVLDNILSDTELTYIISGNQVAIFRDEAKVITEDIHEIISEITVQQQKKSITGTITDTDGEAIIGANIIEAGTTNGTVTDLNGNFSLSVQQDALIHISYIGYLTQEINTAGKTHLDIILQEDTQSLEEVVIVGYGQQKKASVVGAITQIDSEEIKKSGGVSNIGQALQGKLPGVVSIYSNSKPGTEEMKIFIRGQSTWNNSGSPLILVDGVERSMNDVDINEVESISVLKDASATAVYGVKGANGVILLTTKRGQQGKAQFSINAESTFKTVAKLPRKLDSFGSITTANEAILRELMYSEISWENFTPYAIAERYRNQSTQLEREMFPDVDWADYQLEKWVTDYRLNLSIRGGNKTTTYFSNLSYYQENDQFKDFENGKGYRGGYSFRRFNYRSNLDFNITKTTKFSLDLSGSYAIHHRPAGNENYFYLGLYVLAPDLYYPRHEDGTYGFTENDEWVLSNPINLYNSNGAVDDNTFRLNSDFTLKQDLGAITKGLSLQGKFSIDTRITGSQAIADDKNVIFKRYINEEGDVEYKYPVSLNDYLYVIEPWSIGPMNLSNAIARRINYQLSLNYSSTFGEHSVQGLALFKRENYASGSMFPIVYEDWVGRLAYDYNTRYFFEFNTAYNGSEKFGPGYRFELFPSIALGWMASDEKFLENIHWIDKLKFRGSYGIVGDDGFSGRWQYISQWEALNAGAAINSSFFERPSNANAVSPYKFYREKVLGNKEIHWETAIKRNLGLEFAAFKNRVILDMDFFDEYRRDIVIYGNNRSIPVIFGFEPPDANLGKVSVKGYELMLGLRQNISKDLRLRTNFSFTSAKDKVLFADDPAFAPFYQKAEGYPIGQRRAAIPADIMQNWDDIYMSTPLVNGNQFKRTGYYDLIDFDGDGKYDGNYDNTPYGYPTRPQKTWTFEFGGAYKNLSLSCQLYGMLNSTRNYTLRSFPSKTHLFFEDNANYWSVTNPGTVKTLPSWTLGSAASDPYRNLIDASMVRLKMIEIAYTVPEKICRRMHLSGLRIYLNGNNLYAWTKMADDREYSGNNANAQGDYPTITRYNLGLNIDF